MQGSEIICQVISHRSSSAEDDQNKKFQPKTFFLHFFQKINFFFFNFWQFFFQNCLLRHSSFEEVIRTCSNVKIANLVFSFSYSFLVFVAQYVQLLVLSTCLLFYVCVFVLEWRDVYIIPCKNCRHVKENQICCLFSRCFNKIYP